MHTFQQLVSSRVTRSRGSSHDVRQVPAMFSFTLCVMALMLVPALANGSEAPIDISKHISEHSAEVVKAHVVALPVGYYFQFTMPEDLVNKFGCSYPAQTAQDIAELLNILAAGQVVEVPRFHQLGPDPRLIVYLTMRDGRTEKMLVESTLDKPMQEYGLFDGTNVRAMNPEFPKLLRAWAASRQAVVTPTCKKNVLHPPDQN
jgi:hypothetical protein